MFLLKPKDVSKTLNIPPAKISKLAQDLEGAQINKFNRTPLGSFLFIEKEILLLKEYHDLLFFFQKKEPALQYLIQNTVEEEESKIPDWMQYLPNAKFI